MDRKIDNQKSQTKLTGYKMTELGPLPQEWKVVRLGEVAVLIRNGVTIEQEKDKIGYKITRIETISNFFIDEERVGYSNNVNKEILNKYLIKNKDILFSHINSDTHIGKTAIAKKDYEDLLHGMNLLLIRLNENVTVPEFINYLFNHFYFIGLFKKICKRAVNQSSINQANLKSIQIPLPLLPEQRKIAAILSTVQKAIEIEKKLIERTKELKKSMMHKLFTEGIPRQARNGARSEKQKITEIGPIPESWEVVKLGEGDILKSTQYGLSIKGQKKGKYPILRMNNLVDGLVSTSDLQFVNIDEKTFKKFKLEKGDILFNRTNSFELVGKTSIFTSEGDFVFASYLIRLKVNSDIIDHFFFNLYFNWDKTQIRLKSLASRGVSQANISATKLKTFKIPLPTLPEQQAIASILSIIDQKIEHHTTKKQKLEELFRTLLHVLMTARVRVDKINLDFLNEKKGEIYDNT